MDSNDPVKENDSLNKLELKVSNSLKTLNSIEEFENVKSNLPSKSAKTSRSSL